MRRYFVLALLLCSGCAQEAEMLVRDGETLAELNCAAKQLQEERFQLADDIRFAEDSLLERQGDTLLLKKRLDSLKGKIDGLHQQTRVLADSFTHTMNRLHQERYKDRESRKALDAAVAAALKEVCR